jgi:hypothetical protein
LQQPIRALEGEMKIILLVVAAALVVVLVLAMQFSRKVAGLEAVVLAAPATGVRDDLPEVVAAFARRGMAGATTPASGVRLEQAVEMRLKKGADWQPMQARQAIGVGRPGFVWLAAMKVGPLPVVRVIDAYAAGEGLLEVRALGAVPMGREDGPDAARGEAMRYLAELPWSPDAILTNPELRWTEQEGNRVSVALDLADGPASVTFVFDANGDIVAMEANDRPTEDQSGAPTRMDWQGAFRDYGEIGGRRIPRQGEVGWLWPDGYEGYWRGRITGYSLVASAAN